MHVRVEGTHFANCCMLLLLHRGGMTTFCKSDVWSYCYCRLHALLLLFFSSLLLFVKKYGFNPVYVV